MKNTLKTKYLIIGNSAGGIGAAEAIREIDPDGRLTIVSDEQYAAYSRPLISEYVSHERTEDTMLFRDAGFYHRANIDLIKGQRAVSIDSAHKTVRLADGISISWQKLLLATGGMPIVPDIKGSEKKGVFTFTRLDDARKIDSYVTNVNRAVVIGGGLIGISVSEALTKRGIIVSVVEMQAMVLNAILDETASSIADGYIRKQGIRIASSTIVNEIRGGNKVEGVVLANGQEIPCEMVVIAIGVLPRLDLVNGTKIRVNRGICVGRNMSTSVAGIYACGDVAESYDFITDTNRPIPIWPNAYMGGRIAGLNMAGKESVYPGSTSMNSINYFGLDIASAGLVSAPDGSGYEILTRHDGSVYRKIILKDNQIKGMVFVNNTDRPGIIFSLMRNQENVERFKESILADDFGLINFPRERRDKCLVALTPGSHTVPLKETEEQPVADE